MPPFITNSAPATFLRMTFCFRAVVCSICFRQAAMTSAAHCTHGKAETPMQSGTNLEAGPNAGRIEPSFSEKSFNDQPEREGTSQPSQPSHPEEKVLDRQTKSDSVRMPGMASLLTSAFVSACLSVSATIAYLHYFPPLPSFSLPPVMAADMLQVSNAVAKMSAGDLNEAERLFRQGAEVMAQLREAGIVVIDARSVISAPPQAILQPADLIPGAPEAFGAAELSGRASQVDLFDGKDPSESIQAFESQELAIERSGR